MQPIGGTWFVSVNNSYHTVDIRRWYSKPCIGSPLKPTAVGIALTYPNWNKLKNAAVRVETEIPALVAISPCWHDSQIDLMFCDECSPYHKAAEAAENSNTSDNADEH